jgi:ATP-dependent Zn protease
MKKLLALSLLLVSCEAQQSYEIISYLEFHQEVLNDEVAKVIYDNEDSDNIRGWRLDGSKFETSRPLPNSNIDDSIARNLAENGVPIEYRDFDKPLNAYQIMLILLLIFLFFPTLSAFLASSRGQSKALWFFLTLIFPFAVLFIAMKDKTS